MSKKSRSRNQLPIKSRTRKNRTRKNRKKKPKRNKTQNSRQQNYRKKNKKTRKLVSKYMEWNEKQQKTVPGLSVAKRLIMESIKDIKKKNIKTKTKAAIKLTMAAAIIGSYAPVEQKMDLGRLGTRQSGFPGAISDPDVLVKYHNPIVNPKNNITFSNRELKHMQQHLPTLYHNVTY